jgi:hypothetical protein
MMSPARCRCAMPAFHIALLQGSSAGIDVQTGRTIGIDLSHQVLRLTGKSNEPAIEAVPWDLQGRNSAICLTPCTCLRAACMC